MAANEHKDAPLLRIGELARRTGVPAGTLRAWQRRYALIEPERTASGYRLFTERDVERIQRVQRLLDDGISISEAAELMRAAPSSAPSATHEVAGTEPDGLRPGPLTELLVALDGAAAHALLDDLFARFSVSSVASRVLLPALRAIGEGQASGELGIGHEHFASNLLRGRLWGLTRTWDQGGGARAVLAAAPGDHHDLGLLVFGIALRERGWRITYLGVDTPTDVVAGMIRQLGARVGVVSFTRTIRKLPDPAAYAAIEAPLAIGGRAASNELAVRLAADLLPPDPIAASMHELFDRP